MSDSLLQDKGVDTVLNVSQTSPARLSDNRSMKVKLLQRWT